MKRKAGFYFLLPLLSLAFVLFVNVTTGLRADHIILVVSANLAFYLSSVSRRLITGLAIIIIYWIIFDLMKVWPNYLFNEVSIGSLYQLEKNLFGIDFKGSRFTPNEYLSFYQSAFADILCGLFYLSWVPLPLLFAFYLYSCRKDLFLRFSFAFLTVNLIGFVIYYLYPAAPPWYVAEYGMELNTATKSNAAGLLRFDKFFDIQLFSGMYSKGSNVFAAMPSLHASYPLIALYYATHQPVRWISVLFLIVTIGIWFSAIYLNHHYILDIIAGIICGIAGIFIFEKLLMKSKWFKNFYQKYLRAIGFPAMN